MANSYFKFKQFTVYHDHCAMKIGTDGVLVGAWADITNAQHVLDIGTGTGLIALMAAQRSHASITGIEINKEAAEQARRNVENSPWNHIQIIHADIKSFESDLKYDAIISNPPYFTNAPKCAEDSRTTARHATELTFQDLLFHVSRLLHPDGEFSLIIPATHVNEVIGLAIMNKLYPSRKTWVQTTPQKSPKRCMLAFRFKATEKVIENTLVIEASPAVYSEEYKELVKEFYLHM